MPMSEHEALTIATLIKMADKYDSEGKFALAAEVDKTIKQLTAKTPESTPAPTSTSQSIKMSSDELDMFTEKGQSERIAKILASLHRAFEVTKHPSGETTVGLNNTILLAGGNGVYPLLDKKFRAMSKHASLTSEATRQKAPLKHLEEGTKKNLILFLHKADNEVKESLKHLENFFSRLRFFDVSDTVEKMDLDSVMADLCKNEEHLDLATRKFYELLAGRKPRQNDIADMVNDESALTQSAEDFFAEQQSKPKVTVETKVPEVEENAKDKQECCEQCAEDCDGSCYCHDKLDEEELSGFWGNEEKALDGNSVGRISPDGVAITNGTGGQGKKE